MSTDWRALCAELLDEVAARPLILDRELIDRARAALAAEPVADEAMPPRVGHILRLAEIIREVDGNHDKGAAALAEAILSHPRVRSAGLAAEPVVASAGPTDDELLSPDQLRDSWNEQADAMNSWDELGVDEIIWWAQCQALARYGHQPAPPADGEVGEVAAWLRAYCNEEFAPLSIDPDVSWLTRAADLLEQRQAAPVPVAVSERLPQDEDCDSEERCWLLVPRWILPPFELTHWLPATALPLPAGEV